MIVGGIACLVAATVAAASTNVLEDLLAPSGRALGGDEDFVLPDAYVSTYEIIETIGHKPEAFTQGLTFDESGRYLFSSDGLYKQSMVRKEHVLLREGKTVLAEEASTPNAAKHFAEGIAIVGDKLVQLTWQEKQINEFGLDTLEKVREGVPFPVGREGWGLAYDGAKLYVTDSTEYLFHVDPTSYAELARMPVLDPRLAGYGNGKPAWYPGSQSYAKEGPMPIYGVNELEMVEGELWGNVYPMYHRSASECLVRINATSGTVIGWVDMSGLLAKQRLAVRSHPTNYVLNGIAYHKISKRLYVTGKNWDHLYSVRIVPQPERGPADVAKACGLGGMDPSAVLKARHKTG